MRALRIIGVEANVMLAAFLVAVALVVALVVVVRARRRAWRALWQGQRERAVRTVVLIESAQAAAVRAGDRRLARALGHARDQARRFARELP